MLSYTNFTSKDENPRKMREAVEIVKKYNPEFLVDGEMQADSAVNPDIIKRIFSFCEIKDGANILVFSQPGCGKYRLQTGTTIGSGGSDRPLPSGG